MCREKKKRCMKLYQEPIIFQSLNPPGDPRTTRCSELRVLAELRTAKTRPTLENTHLLDRLDWAKKHLKTDFSKGFMDGWNERDS